MNTYFPEAIKADLDAIGWSVRELARQIGRSEDTVRSWVRRGTMPDHLRNWLRLVADWHRRLERPTG